MGDRLDTDIEMGRWLPQALWTSVTLAECYLGLPKIGVPFLGGPFIREFYPICGKTAYPYFGKCPFEVVCLFVCLFIWVSESRVLYVFWFLPCVFV